MLQAAIESLSVEVNLSIHLFACIVDESVHEGTVIAYLGVKRKASSLVT